MRLFRHFQVLKLRSAKGKRSIFLLMVKVSRQIIQRVPRSNTLFIFFYFFYQRVLAKRKLFLPLNLSVADVLIRMKDWKLSEALRKHRGLSVSTLSSSVETTKINKNGWCVFTFWQILPHRLASEPESAVNLDFIAPLNENKHHNTRQIRTNEAEATDTIKHFFLFDTTGCQEGAKCLLSCLEHYHAVYLCNKQVVWNETAHVLPGGAAASKQR